MKYSAIFIFLLLLLSCSSRYCTVADPNFVSTFKSRLDTVAGLEKGRMKVGADQYVMTITYLSKITGFSSRSDYSSTMGYRNKKFYGEDMKKWKNWLSENKCWYTTAIADSVMKVK
jgi:hypothetical protein